MNKMKMKLLLLLLLAMPCCGQDFSHLATAIRHAEGDNPHWFYGIHHSGQKSLSEAEARRRCIVTCEGVWLDWDAAGRKEPYLDALARVYCPLGASRWEGNVKSCLRHLPIK